MTLRAMNQTITQSHFNQLATASGEPRRIARVNQSAQPTSVFSFVGCELNQLTPRCVSDVFSETVILHHPGDVQIFENDNPESINKIADSGSIDARSCYGGT